MTPSKTMTHMLVAGAVGAAIGMLIAPQKGSDNRKAFFDSVDGLFDDLLEVKDKVTGLVEQVKTAVSDIQGTMQSKIEQVKEGVADFNTLKEHAGQALS